MPLVEAIVVTYHPNCEQFTDLITSLSLQCDKVLIVDNTESTDNVVFNCLSASNISYENIFLLRFGGNLGVAEAINIGINYIFDDAPQFIILSDQDSLPSRNMVANLIRAYREISCLGLSVGALGPTFTDLNTYITYPFQAQLPGRFFYGHKLPKPDEPHVEALTLITSGTLIPYAALRDIGLMREDFFIDQVDIEWCHRARSKGYRLFGTGLATMFQRMGDSSLRVWYLRWRFESAYSPLRIYYKMRNYVVLCQLGYIDWRWKLRSLRYLIGIIYSHIVFGTRRLESMKMTLIGIWHGITNKMGRFDRDSR